MKILMFFAVFFSALAELRYLCLFAFGILIYADPWLLTPVSGRGRGQVAGQAAARLSLSRKTFSYEMRFVMKVELQNGGASHIFNIHVLQSIHTHTRQHTHTSLHAM